MDTSDNIENIEPNKYRGWHGGRKMLPTEKSKRAVADRISPTKDDIEKYGSYNNAYYNLNKHNYRFKYTTGNKVGRPKKAPEDKKPSLKEQLEKLQAENEKIKQTLRSLVSV